MPSLPSLQRVVMPTFPVALIPLLRWKRRSASRVIGPEMPSTVAAIETLCGAGRPGAPRSWRSVRRQPARRPPRAMAAATTITMIRRTELRSFAVYAMLLPDRICIGHARTPSSGATLHGRCLPR